MAYMSGLGVDMENQTHSVSFGSEDLKNWMSTVEPFVDEYRICLSFDSDRLSVIIWPYNSGSPAVDGEEKGIEPFNEGNLNP